MSTEVTVPLLFRNRMKAHPDCVAQTWKDETGAFVTRTYRELYGDVLDFAQALKDLGVRREDHVGIISDNRREWLIADLAIQSLGAADVPRGCDSMEREIAFILSATDCRIAIAENRAQLAKMLNSRDALPLLSTVIMFADPSDEDTARASARGVTLLSFRGVLADGSARRAGNDGEIEAEMDRGRGRDVATIIFTSGTTGEPKGVMLTESNYVWQLERTPDRLYGEPGDVWLSVLPVWHSFERLMQYIALERSSAIAYSKPVASVMLPDIAAVRPHVIPGVPRLWEALASGIMRTVKKEGGAKKALFLFFVAVGKRYCLFRDMTTGRVARFAPRSRALDATLGFIPWLFLFSLNALGDALVFSKVRAKLGGRIRICISGGGALQAEVDAFYRAIGVNMIEGYGITETAPLLSLRDQWRPRPGCVGEVFTDTECRVVDPELLSRAIEDAAGGDWRIPEALGSGRNGVLVVRGGQVMKGYYKRPDLTKRVIDADGWFNTGDLGMLSWDNEIKITGRAKDTIVLLGGENIEPAPIERAIKGSDLVASVGELGQDRKHLPALVVPARDAVLARATDEGLPTDDYEALLENPAILQLFRGEIDARINHHAGFRPFEVIFRIGLLAESFQVGRELSGKQEMMRHRIGALYASQIAALFEESRG